MSKKKIELGKLDSERVRMLSDAWRAIFCGMRYMPDDVPAKVACGKALAEIERVSGRIAMNCGWWYPAKGSEP